MKKPVAVLIVLLMILSCFAVGMAIATQDKTQGNDQKKMAGANKKAEKVTEGLSDMEDFRGAFPKKSVITAPKLEAPLNISFQPLRCPSVTFPAVADIFVNETGWWGDGSAFNSSATPIQSAITNATDGSTIYVYNGTYNESLTIPINLTLIGENRDVTFIDGMSSNCINVTAADVEIMGFTIQNGSAGIYVKADDASVTVVNNNISGNDYGGVQINASDRIVADITCNIISDNGCDCGDVFTGGGIRMYVNASTGTINATIRDNNIEYNRGGGIRLGWWGASQHPDYGNASGPFAGLQRVCGTITALIDNNTISNNKDGSIRIKSLDTIDATVTNNYIGSIEETSAGGLVRIGWVSEPDGDDPSKDYAYPTQSVTANISGNTIECGNYSDNVSTGGMIRILANDTINATVNDNYLHGGHDIGGVIRIGFFGWTFAGSPTKVVTATVINNTLNFTSNLTAGDWPQIGGLIRIVAQDTINATVNENRIFGSGSTGGVIHIGYADEDGWEFPPTKEVTAAVIGNYLDCGNASDGVDIGGFIRIVAQETIDAIVNDNYLRGGDDIGTGIRIGYWDYDYGYLPATNVTAQVINNTLNFTDSHYLGGGIRITALENLVATVNENNIYGNEVGEDTLQGGGIRIGWFDDEAQDTYPCTNVTATVNDNFIEPCNGGAIRIMANETLDATVMNNTASGNKGSGIRIGYFCWKDGDPKNLPGALDYATPTVTATVVNNTVTDNYGSGIHVAAQDNLTAVIVGNTIANNTYCDDPASEYVANGSGLIVEGRGDVTITSNNTFLNNALYGIDSNGITTLDSNVTAFYGYQVTDPGDDPNFVPPPPGIPAYPLGFSLVATGPPNQDVPFIVFFEAPVPPNLALYKILPSGAWQLIDPADYTVAGNVLTITLHFDSNGDLDPAFQFSSRFTVPTLTPLGLLALAGLLAIIATISIIRKKEREGT
jgi:hypothetical protein